MNNMRRWLVLIILVAACGIGFVFCILGSRTNSIYDVFPTANVTGMILDKNVDYTDNFKNGKINIEITIMTLGIDNVLSPISPLNMEIWGHKKQWTVPTINLRENSGKTETSYGENVECDGVVAGPENSGDNLYVKISVPTTTQGNVVVGMSINIEMWPTDNPVDPIDGVISPANFDNLSTFDWWDQGDFIDIVITGSRIQYNLTDYNGAHLTGMEIDE